MTRVLFDRIDEDFALIEEMLALVPNSSEDWRPDWPGDLSFTMSELVAHLAESCGGVCACFARLHPEMNWTRAETAGLSVGRNGRVIAAYRAQVREALALTRDDDWMRVIPTYFVPEGEPFLAVVLTNLKHVNHHVHQLFTYLKVWGVPVGTRHLYRFK
jgi:hypothetical protein